MPQPTTCNKQAFATYGAAMAAIKLQVQRKEAKHAGSYSGRRVSLHVYKCPVCQGDVFHMTSKPKTKASKGKIW